MIENHGRAPAALPLDRKALLYRQLYIKVLDIL